MIRKNVVRAASQVWLLPSFVLLEFPLKFLKMVCLKAAAAILALVPLAFFHPGESAELIKREMQARNDQHAVATRSLAACQGSEQSVALKQRAAARRAAKVTDLRAKRGLTNSNFSTHLI